MTKRLIAMLLGVLLSGCTSTPATEFYVLEASNQGTPATIHGEKQQLIGIGPISIPALLDNQKIVTRSSGNTVQIAEFQQWASPLQDNLLQALTRNLSALQPNNIVRTYPWSIHGTVDRQIIVDIVRFDSTPGKSANLEANWTIKNETSNTVLKSGHSVIIRPLADLSYPGTVKTLSKLLGEFSQELSSALLNLEMTNK